MNRTFLALAVCAAVGIGGMALARHDEKDTAKVTDLSRRDIVEKLDGKDARVTVEEVAIEPGGQVRPHRHTGPVFGYVLEGEYEHALDDDPVTTYKAGDTFYEPSGCVHRVTRNPSARAKTRLLAVILHPRRHRKGHGPGGGRQERLTVRLPGTGRRRSITWPGPPTSPGIRRPSIALARRSRLPPPSRRGNG
jgi:quercetin dioxygenase-like cupin family protein